MLKDPDSAKFGGIKERISVKNGMHVACGTVNAKNGFGGYGGFKRFISAGNQETTLIEGKTALFAQEWASLCD